MTTPGHEPMVPPLPTPGDRPPPALPDPAKKPAVGGRSRAERMGGDTVKKPGAVAPTELDLINPDDANKTDTVTLRVRLQHRDYLIGLREAISIRYGVSKRVIDEAIVLLVQQHRDALIEQVQQFHNPNKVIDLDKFLG